MAKSPRTLEIFYCYARADKHLRDRLEEHLEPLRRTGLIISWHDREIRAGENWQRAIDIHLERADLILLLISPSFMRSDYCYGIEMQQALERHLLEEAYVIPIILRPTAWQHTPLGQIQALPRDGKPIVAWRSRDDAFAQIAQEIHTVILRQLSEDRNQKAYWIQLGQRHLQAGRYQQALLAYQHACQLDPNNAALYHKIGNILARLNRFDEALAAFKQSVHLVPDNIDACQGKADMLFRLCRYEDALACYEKITMLFQENSAALCGMGHALFALQRCEEALAVYERAICHAPENAFPYYYKGLVLMSLARYEEAYTAYEQAIKYKPNESSFYFSTAQVLERLGDTYGTTHNLVLGDYNLEKFGDMSAVLDFLKEED